VQDPCKEQSSLQHAPTLLPGDPTIQASVNKMTSGTKITVVDSTINNVLALNTPKDASQQEEKFKENKETMQTETTQEVLDTGKPEDLIPPVLGAEECLPMLEQDQPWISTKVQTEKPPWSPSKMWSENLWKDTGQTMMVFQLGPIVAPFYWVYWVPPQ
ncbi:Ubiquitin domain-containing protein UBFD1, partial [Galemys pyrenaicus]